MRRETVSNGEGRGWQRAVVAATACLALAACGASRTAETDYDDGYARQMADIAKALNDDGEYRDVQVALDTTVPISSQMVNEMGAIGISQPVWLEQGVYGYFKRDGEGNLVGGYVETDSELLHLDDPERGPANPEFAVVDLSEVCRPPVEGETRPYCVVAADAGLDAGLDGYTERIGDLAYSGK